MCGSSEAVFRGFPPSDHLKVLKLAITSSSVTLMLIPLQKRVSDGGKPLLRFMHLVWSGRLSGKYVEQHGQGEPDYCTNN